MNKRINILIVEDHALTRFALLTSLKEQKFVKQIFESANAVEAYDIIAKNKIDVVLMDLGLPNINGVKATKAIKTTNPEIKVIIITSHNEQDEVVDCLNAGISAYCSKDIKPDKLIEVIQDVLRGSIWFDSNISDFVLNAAKNVQAKSQKDYSLTSKEKEVLNLLKSGLSNIEIANELNISINTIKVHVCSILQKLNVDDRTQAVIKAIKENI